MRPELLLAEKCENCGELFDLNFDLHDEMGLDGADLDSRKNEAHFCWNCRKELGKKPKSLGKTKKGKKGGKTMKFVENEDLDFDDLLEEL